MSELIRVCIDPPELEQPANVATRMALMKGATWGPGYNLKVKFLEGTKAMRDKVKKYAERWEQHANVNMIFVKDGDADVRITFQPGPSSSLLGKKAQQQQPDQTKPTMNFGWFSDATPEEEFQRVVLHEFGHALGCIHEHQNPAGGIEWDTDKVYAYYAQYGWNKERVDRNVLNAYAKDLIRSTATVDKLSIMLYPVDKHLTKNGFEAGWNNDLSVQDKKFIKKLYPW